MLSRSMEYLAQPGIAFRPGGIQGWAGGAGRGDVAAEGTGGFDRRRSGLRSTP
jgi:hypothetical protein